MNCVGKIPIKTHIHMHAQRQHFDRDDQHVSVLKPKLLFTSTVIDSNAPKRHGGKARSESIRHDDDEHRC